MVISRERSLTHYEVLGVSPTCEPEIIEAAYQSLIGKYGEQDLGAERIRKFEEAYETLKDPRRRRTYDAMIAKSAPVVADVKTWTVKPRAGSSRAAPSSPAVATIREPVATTTSDTVPPPKARRGGPRRKPSPSHDPAVSGNPSATNRPVAKRSAAKHLIFIPDPSVEKAPASLSELLLPPGDSPEEPPRGQFNWSGVGLPLAGVFAVVGAALGAQHFFDTSSPGGAGTDVQRPTPAAAGQAPIMVTREGARSADRDVLFEGPNPLPMSADASGSTDAVPDSMQSVAAEASSGIAQTTSPTTGSTPAAGSVAKQSASTAQGPSQAAPSAIAENQQVVVPTTTVQQSKGAPVRWIKGGLLDSDNPGGRFEGAVGVRITVRPDGYAGACHVTQSSGNQALDDITCKLVQRRLQFDPARNAAGQAMQSEVLTTYTWGRKVRKK